MAEVVARVLDGGLPRRSNPVAAPIATMDTCATLDAATVRSVPGLDSTATAAGLAGWSCGWGRDDGVQPYLTVTLDRIYEDTAGVTSPRRVGDHDARLDTQPHECAISVVQRRFTGAAGQQYIDAATVDLSDPGRGGDAICADVWPLAAKVAATLPR